MAIAEVSPVTPGVQETQSASVTAARAASVALVPVVAPWRLAPAAQGLARPDPSFVTHLIAMAALSPQTRLLRRAAPEDVQAAYLAVAHQNQRVTPPGARMRQIV